MDFSSEMLASRVRRMRLQKKMSIEQLAKEAEVDKNTIVRIEKGDGRPNLKTLINICGVLGVMVDKLIDLKTFEGEDYYIERANGKQKKFSGNYKPGEPGINVGSLTKLPFGLLNVVKLEIFGDGKMRSHRGEELLFCLEGKVGIVIGNTPIVLDQGDSLLFFGREPHLYYNADKGENAKPAIALSVWLDEEIDMETHQLSDYHIES